jgi:hypothetical protein
MRVHRFNRFPPSAADFPLQAGAENGVHQQIGRQFSAAVNGGSEPRRRGPLARRFGRRRAGVWIGERQYRTSNPALTRQSRYDIAVAAIVAAAANHGDPPRLRPALAQQLKAASPARLIRV